MKSEKILQLLEFMATASIVAILAMGYAIG